MASNKGEVAFAALRIHFIANPRIQLGPDFPSGTMHYLGLVPIRIRRIRTVPSVFAIWPLPTTNNQLPKVWRRSFPW